MQATKGIMTKRDMQLLQAAKRRANQETLRLEGLDRELARARALLPRLDELNRLDLEQWIDRVTGHGSGVMSADIGEANEMLEKFRYSLRMYERGTPYGKAPVPDETEAGRTAAEDQLSPE